MNLAVAIGALAVDKSPEDHDALCGAGYVSPRLLVAVRSSANVVNGAALSHVGVTLSLRDDEARAALMLAGYFTSTRRR